MRYAIRDHQGKGAAFARALSTAGHPPVPLGDPAELLLIDLDFNHPGYWPLLNLYANWGARIVVYPHGAAPIMAYDGVWEAHPDVDDTLVPAPGHVEIAEAVGYPHPTHVVGFPFCDQLPFRATDGGRVLFAPHHPFGDGTLGEREQAENAAVFAALLALGGDLTVRHIGTLEQNGLWEAPGCRYVSGTMEVSTADIDDADVTVAAHGTYGYLSVARGCPTVMFGQDIDPYDIRDGVEVPCASWESYRHVLRYPYDFHELGVVDAILQACQSEAVLWRERLIGPKFDAGLVCRIATGVPAHA